MAATGAYPVRVDAWLDPPLSRWLWLVKWVLLIPHYVVLAFLWLAFMVLSVAAFFAILFTGRYPRAIFEFNVGVLRWTWRVQYYAIGAFGTDRYPPFTLADVASYPAHLDIDYPQRLSRGLVLVKWWLLVIPQYLVISLFTSSGWAGLGLIGVLAVIAGATVLFTGQYPQQVFDVVLGMNRWVLRVAAYAGLMTDQYPPFRLDMGGHEPGGTLAVPPSPGPPGGPGARPAMPLPEQSPGQAPPARAAGWTTGRVVSLVVGVVLALVSLGTLGGGGTALWADTTQRDAGFVDLGTTTYTTAGYAVASDTLHAHAGWEWLGALIGQARLRVTGTGPGQQVFAGIAPAGAVKTYLSGVAHTTVTRFSGNGERVSHPGDAAPGPPASAAIWTARASGTPTATLLWTVRNGDWAVVAMNADGSPNVSVRVDAALQFPSLRWIAVELLVGGAVLAMIALACIIVPIRLAGAP